jgi:hypothetical protein
MVHAVAVDEGRLLTLEDNAFNLSVDLTIFNLSVPSAPRRLAEHNVAANRSAWPHGNMVASAGRLYIALSDGLHIWDVSDPAAPVHLARLDLGPDVSPHQVTVAGTLAVVGSLGVPAEVRVFDVSQPKEAYLREAVAVPFGTFGLVPGPDPGTVVIATVATSGYGNGDYYSAGSGIAVLALAGDQPAYVARRLRLPYLLTALDCAGQWCFLAEGQLFDSGVHVLDVGVPERPVLSGWLPLSDALSRLQIAGSRVYGITEHDLVEIDVTVPSRPRLSWSGPLAHRPYDLAVDGGFAFVTDNYQVDIDEATRTLADLHVFDLSEASRPKPLGTFPLDTAIEGRLQVREGYGYLVAHGRRGQSWSEIQDAAFELQVLDLRHPSQVRKIASVPAPMRLWPGLSAREGDILWAVGTATYGIGTPLLRADVSRPHEPRWLSVGTIPAYPRGLLPIGRHLVALDCQLHLTVLDVARPSDMLVAGGLPLPIDPYSGWECSEPGAELRQTAGHLVLGVGRSGVRIVRLRPADHPVRGGASSAGPPRDVPGD